MEVEDIENSDEFQLQEVSKKPVDFCRSRSVLPADNDAKSGSPIPGETNILLAEDDPINQLVMLKIFKRMGIVPDLAQNGLEVLEMTSCKRYDLIFMDVQMPEMDGLTAVKELREREKSDGHKFHTSVVALTAFALDGDERMCLVAGMDDYLCKPVSSQDLRRVLCRWVGDEKKASSLRKARSPTIATLIDQIRLQVLCEEVGEETFSSIIQVAMIRIKERAVALQAALDQGDVDAIKQLAHKLKGTCLQLGAISLGNVANNLERLARAGALDDARIAASDLDKIVQQSIIAIGKGCDEPA